MIRLPGGGNWALGDAKRACAYFFAALSGLVAGLVRSNPELGNEYWSVMLGVSALVAALSFTVISTNDYRSLIDRLFRCGIAAIFGFFLAVTLNSFVGEYAKPFGVFSQLDLVRLLLVGLLIIIISQVRVVLYVVSVSMLI